MSVGKLLGASEGAWVSVGSDDGASDGACVSVGNEDGASLGACVSVGNDDGASLGAWVSVGKEDGTSDGACVSVGKLEGAADGDCVSVGKLDGAFARPGASEWDVAAADLILNEAGAKLTDRNGAAIRYNQPNVKLPSLVAGNGDQHSDILSLANSCGILH